MTPFPTGTIIIFDTEYTTWDGTQARNWSGPGEHRELVQIAAQKVDVDNEQVLDTFSALVRPRINPTLSDFFTELTHITQAEVDADGVDFAVAYPAFMEWCDNLPIFSYGSSKRTDGDILLENIELYELDLAYDSTQHHNLRPLFAEHGIDVSQYTSGQLFRAFDLELTGHVHNAMHDVDSLVQSLFALKSRV
jgi:inhibitor of KinA sporulation pathway (predicted exonuclease)